MLMADKAQQAAASPQACLLDPVPIAATVQTQVAVMHRQDRNNANNIFGGHLLRLASELAYCTGVLHASRECEIVALGDVNFLQPVPIGCVLALRAKVTYTAGHLMRIAVIATKHQQLLGRSTDGFDTGATNDFTFVLAVIGADQLRPVEPESMREALQYLASHRQHVSDGYEVPELLTQHGAEALWTRGAGR